MSGRSRREGVAHVRVWFGGRISIQHFSSYFRLQVVASALHCTSRSLYQTHSFLSAAASSGHQRHFSPPTPRRTINHALLHPSTAARGHSLHRNRQVAPIELQRHRAKMVGRPVRGMSLGQPTRLLRPRLGEIGDAEGMLLRVLYHPTLQPLPFLHQAVLTPWTLIRRKSTPHTPSEKPRPPGQSSGQLKKRSRTPSNPPRTSAPCRNVHACASGTRSARMRACSRRCGRSWRSSWRVRARRA